VRRRQPALQTRDARVCCRHAGFRAVDERKAWSAARRGGRGRSRAGGGAAVIWTGRRLPGDCATASRFEKTSREAREEFAALRSARAPPRVGAQRHRDRSRNILQATLADGPPLAASASCGRRWSTAPCAALACACAGRRGDGLSVPIAAASVIAGDAHRVLQRLAQRLTAMLDDQCRLWHGRLTPSKRGLTPQSRRFSRCNGARLGTSEPA